jgi:hypothetical protein
MSPLPSAQTASAKPVKRRRGRPPGGTTLGQDVSREARRIAALILEVLAGSRTTGDAAAALGIGMTRYHVLETRAVHGLVAACEPRTQGRQRSVTADLQAMRRDCERWKREALRQQALVRAAHRTIGLMPAPAAPARATSKKRQRRPVARALAAAAHLQATDNAMSASEATIPEGSQQQPKS